MKKTIEIQSFRFRMNTDLRFGEGVLSSLAPALQENNFHNLGIILDKNVQNIILIKNLVEELFDSFDSELFVCEVAEPDYHYLDIFKDKMKHGDFDCLIGIGGGSVMDLSKGLAVLLRHSGQAINFKGFPKIENKPIPVITIPTLAGTGSEIAYNAVFTDSDEKMRLGINTELNYPMMAFVDPALSLSAPRRAVISGALDCLNHTIEGFISENASQFTKEISKSAFYLWYKSVTRINENFDDINARSELFMASIYANMALNNVGSGLGGDFSYPLGALYGVPHGIGEGMFLPYIYSLYVDRGFSGFSGLYDSIPDQESGLSDKQKSLKVCELLEGLYTTLKVPTSLNEFGIDRSMIPILVEEVRGSFDSAPVEFNEIDARKLFEHFVK